MTPHTLASCDPRPSQEKTDRKKCLAVMGILGAACDTEIDEMSKQGRGDAKTAHARQIGMYLAHVTWGWSLSRTAAAFKRERSTISHSCRQVELQRDNTKFDEQLKDVEKVANDLISLSLSWPGEREVI